MSLPDGLEDLSSDNPLSSEDESLPLPLDELPGPIRRLEPHQRLPSLAELPLLEELPPLEELPQLEELGPLEELRPLEDLPRLASEKLSDYSSGDDEDVEILLFGDASGSLDLSCLDKPSSPRATPNDEEACEPVVRPTPRMIYDDPAPSGKEPTAPYPTLRLWHNQEGRRRKKVCLSAWFNYGLNDTTFRQLVDQEIRTRASDALQHTRVSPG